MAQIIIDWLTGRSLDRQAVMRTTSGHAVTVYYTLDRPSVSFCKHWHWCGCGGNSSSSISRLTGVINKRQPSSASRRQLTDWTPAASAIYILSHYKKTSPLLVHLNWKISPRRSDDDTLALHQAAVFPYSWVDAFDAIGIPNKPITRLALISQHDSDDGFGARTMSASPIRFSSSLNRLVRFSTLTSWPTDGRVTSFLFAR